jgi:hypothetical protein
MITKKTCCRWLDDAWRCGILVEYMCSAVKFLCPFFRALQHYLMILRIPPGLILIFIAAGIHDELNQWQSRRLGALHANPCSIWRDAAR